MPIKCILAPLPQFKWGQEHAFVNLSPTIFLGPLMPVMRRNMLNDAKRQNASASALRVTLESDHVVVAQVPVRESELTMFNAVLYTYVVDLALKRFVDLLRLIDDVPDCFDRSCWYTADGNPAEQSTVVSLSYPEWTCPSVYASGVHPGIGLAFFIHDDWKSHSPELLRIDELDGIFTTFLNDPTLMHEVHSLCTKRIEEFLRMQASEELGVPPDEVTFEYDEPEERPGWKHTLFQNIRVIVPEQYAKNGAHEIGVGDVESLYWRWFGEASFEMYLGESGKQSANDILIQSNRGSCGPTRLSPIPSVWTIRFVTWHALRALKRCCAWVLRN